MKFALFRIERERCGNLELKPNRKLVCLFLDVYQSWEVGMAHLMIIFAEKQLSNYQLPMLGKSSPFQYCDGALNIIQP